MWFDPDLVRLFITSTPYTWEKTSTLWSCHPYQNDLVGFDLGWKKKHFWAELGLISF